MDLIEYSVQVVRQVTLHRLGGMCYRVAFHGPAQSIICQLLASLILFTLSSPQSPRQMCQQQTTSQAHDFFKLSTAAFSSWQSGHFPEPEWLAIFWQSMQIDFLAARQRSWIFCHVKIQLKVICCWFQPSFIRYVDWSQSSSAPTGHSEVMWGLWQKSGNQPSWGDLNTDLLDPISVFCPYWW